MGDSRTTGSVPAAALPGAHAETRFIAAGQLVEDLEGERLRNAVAARLFSEDEALTRVGRYVILAHIGSGGCGDVYAAYDPELDRKVAVKVVRPTHDDLEASQRILREARAMAQLAHPNVVPVYDAGSDNDRVFVAMEWIRGVTLGEWLTHDRHWREILRVFIDAGRGLSAAHRVGLVHRDFKPNNVMVSEALQARVLDFGLAKGILDAEEYDHTSEHELSKVAAAPPRITAVGAVMGTPRYMAPELFDGAADARVDQYAFCTALFEALFGRAPFPSTTEGTIAGMVAAKRTREILVPDSPVPRKVIRAMLRGLRSEPDERWESMDALLGELAHDPARSRIRWVAGAVVILSGGVGFGVFELHHASVVKQCEVDSQGIFEVWDEGRRKAVSNAMLADSTAMGAASHERTQTLVDKFADDWADTRLRTCEHAASEPVPQRLVEATNACLRRRKQALGALVEALSADVGSTGLQTSVDAAARLPRISECEDERQLMMRQPLPEGHEGRVVEAEKRLAEARASLALQRSQRALEIARQVGAATEDLDSGSLRSQVSLVASAALRDLGRFDEALLESQAAAFEAALAGEPHGAVEAQISIVILSGTGLARPDEGLAASALVERALVERGLQDDLVAAQWHLAVASLQNFRGELDDALEHQSNALALLELAYGPEHVSMVKPALERAQTLQLQGKNDQARSQVEFALRLAEESLGPNHPSVAQALNGVGIMRLAAGDPDGGAKALRRAIEIWEPVYGPDYPNLAAALTNLALAEAELGRTDLALEHLDRSLAIKNKTLGPEHQSVGMTLEVTGRILLLKKRYEEAYRSFEQALPKLERDRAPHHPHVVRALHGLVAAARNRGAHEDAMRWSRRLVAALEQRPSGKDPDLADAQLEFAKLAWSHANGQEAYDAAANAMERLATPGVQHPRQRAVIEQWLSARQRP